MRHALYRLMFIDMSILFSLKYEKETTHRIRNELDEHIDKTHDSIKP